MKIAKAEMDAEDEEEEARSSGIPPVPSLPSNLNGVI